MNETAVEVLNRLDAMGIRYEVYTHAPARTIADCIELDGQINAVTAKNFFLCTRNKKHYFLLITMPEAHFESGKISKELGSARLSFADETAMREKLRTYPGAVTPLGLLFDANKEVRLAVDEELLGQERIAFHPCDNTMTVSMAAESFWNVFLPRIDRDYIPVKIHPAEEQEGEIQE